MRRRAILLADLKSRVIFCNGWMDCRDAFSCFFFLPFIPKIMFTAPINLQIMLIYVIVIPRYEFDIVVITQV